jgi:hypothetical protein
MREVKASAERRTPPSGRIQLRQCAAPKQRFSTTPVNGIPASLPAKLTAAAPIRTVAPDLPGPGRRLGLARAMSRHR